MHENRPISSTDTSVLEATDIFDTSKAPGIPSLKRPRIGGPDSRMVTVIGSGVGALSAAIKCQAAGHQVTVYERANHLGGKLHAVSVNGRRIDYGPTVFTLKPIFDDLFTSAGLRFDDYAQTQKLDELAYHIWPDDSDLTLYADLTRSVNAIKKFSTPLSVPAFRSMAATSARAFSALDNQFMRQSGPSILALLKGFNFQGLLAGSPLRSLWAKLDQLYDDKRLAQLFARYATYCGSSPFLAPATLLLVAHAEQRGVWAIKDGMAGLAKALVLAAKDLGVAFNTNLGVETIEIKNNRASSVLLSNGRIVDTDAIVFGGDVSALTSGLLGGTLRAAAPKFDINDRSLSAITIQLTAHVKGRDMGYHTVVFGADYPDEFDAIFNRSSITKDPTIYLCFPDRGPYPEHSPDGDERVYMLINAPANGDTHRYSPEEKDAWFNHIMTRLKRHQVAITPTANPVITSPTEFAAAFPATGGALYGRANHGPFASFKRPAVKTPIKGLYLAGGSTHPSPGVPMASLSGQMAADCLIWDLISAKA